MNLHILSSIAIAFPLFASFLATAGATADITSFSDHSALSDKHGQQTYCGCPQCTQAVWDALACDVNLGGCHSCGNRVLYVESINGGNKDEACKTVATQFPNGPCDVCNPDTCNAARIPSQSPTPKPTPEPTSTPEPAHCGCPRCTQAVWDALACDVNLGGCYTCGDRISYVESINGGNKGDACKAVATQFPNGPCDVCNPDTCNVAAEPTRAPSPPSTPKPIPSPTVAPTPLPSHPPSNSPTAAPTAPPSMKPTDTPTSEPTKTPTHLPIHDPTPEPTTQEPVYCGCPQCTQSVWDALACNDRLGGCHTCGGRISYVESINGGNRDEACKTVANEFPNDSCGVCNPILCNKPVLDDPDPTKLIWSDEFDADGVPDPSNWSYDIGDGCDKGLCGWGNGELQYYTDSPNNVIVENGLLRISAKKESVGGKDYTSARMVTRGNHAFRFGRIQFRARTAGCTARGTWPALWLLPEEWVYGGWPNSGEIDVMESVGYEENKFHGSVHTSSYNHGIGTQKTASIIKSELEWHIFEIDWQVDKIRFAVDKELYLEFAPDDVNDSAKWPFNQDFHLIMNIAVGGNWGGVQGVDAASFEGDGQYMEVDWVRVYSM